MKRAFAGFILRCRMRLSQWNLSPWQFRAVIAASALAGMAVPAAASETGPTIAVPGRADVPVMLNGRDVTGAVIEGDWGLARPSNINPTVIYRLWPPPPVPPPAKAFYPGSGRPPKFGRKEIESPPGQSPPQAQEYQRSWSSQSDPNPATILPPYDPPPVIVAPPEGRLPPPRPRKP